MGPAVLVVEDDADTRRMIEDLLTLSEYHPLVVSSGEDAVATVEREPVDLVLLDLRLPDMHGYDVCARIRSGSAADVPVLMVTANEEVNGAATGLRLGADDYLRKPFAPDELLVRMEMLLRRHQNTEGMRTTVEELQTSLAHARSSSDTEQTLRREFLHHVTTHMRALQGVIESEYRRAPLGPAREIVQRILSRVHNVALVYETSEALQDEPARIDTVIYTIAPALKQVYAPRRRVPLSIAGGPLEMPLRYAAPIAMILNELVTNSFKHAFPDQRFGAITVRYRLEPAEFHLEVIDDGVGIADRFKPSRGMNTVWQLAMSLGGEARWENTTGVSASGTTSGTTVKVSFPYTPGETAAEDVLQIASD